MGKYIMRRVVGLVPTLLLLLFLVVLLIDLIPGDIVDLMLAERTGSNDETARAALEEQLGLTKPLPLRYVDYTFNALKGDLGASLWTQRPVTELIAGRAMASIEIGILSILFGSVSGVVIGAISAVRQDGWLDYLLRSVSIIGISVPTFAIATAIVVLPAIWWGIAPSLRYVSFAEAPIDHIKIVLLPSIVLGIGLSATVMRLTRTTMLEVLRQDYIRTAHAKGVAERAVVFKHALKNAMIPVVTVLGLQVAFLIGGSVIVESVFAIPGVGRLLLSAISNRDYPIVQGVVLVIGVFVMVTNLLVDVSYAWLDPRIRYA
ncbi:MAG: ABC transporter permease [Dehalococcoidia bacterium]|nr:ABC transporter permease [Dehalococcoidia bacterium]